MTETDDEPIDPEIARFVAAIQAGYARHPGMEALPLDERRAIAETVRAPWREGGPGMRRRCERTLPCPGGEVVVRLLDASGAPGPRPALVYLHGGGFTSFSLDTHDRLMREYAARAECLVLGVDYALSPEAKFPAALQQVVAVLEWLGEHGAELGVDPRRIAIGGDSAGANLALAAAVKLRDEGSPKRIAALLLNYGFFDADFTTPSQTRHGGEGRLLTTEELRGYLENYLGGTPHARHPLALPAHAELSGLPPSFHVIAQCDPLADGDQAIAERMQAAGDAVESRVYPGATHSFLEAVSISRLADQALTESSEWLKAQLA